MGQDLLGSPRGQWMRGRDRLGQPGHSWPSAQLASCEGSSSLHSAFAEHLLCAGVPALQHRV